MAVQLYTHSDYSLLESVLQVEELVKQAAKLEIKALALTDHNTTAGHYELEQYCNHVGIKPIFGLELDVAYLGVAELCQVVILALNSEGYGNLLRLASLPTPVDFKILPAYKAGLAFLEGGVGGGITKLHARGEIKQALALHAWYQGEFGVNYYLRHELGQDLSLFASFPVEKFVLCQDVRYADPVSRETLAVLARLQGDAEGNSRPSPYPLLSFSELTAKFQGPAVVVEQTLRLAASCSVKLPRARMATVSSEQSLEELAWRGAQERYGQLTEEIRARLQHELHVIKDLGFEDYFLIVADIVRFAKQAQIPVGPGRGSAASSLVAYVLGITEVDPLAWGLLFERFLNPERATRPDIDLDFCYQRRGEVLSYVAKRFGREHVAQIGTYGTFGPRSAAREVQRVLGRENSCLAQEIQNLKRHRATHAAGVIITNEPVQSISAVDSEREIPVTHLDMYALEALGVLKIDLLGLRTLTLLEQMEAEVRKSSPDFSLAEIPLQDADTFALLGQGKTLGIFQLESDLFQDLLRRLKPCSFNDLVALLALGRPGPLNMFPEFVARRKTPSRVKFLHPELENILGETYGLILYQEQVMLIAHRLGGLSLGEADLLRSALGKGDAEATAKWQRRFVQGALANGLDERAARQLFSDIAKFSGYAFNKAHSVSYALLTWQAAYLKSNYPREFFITLLNHGGSGKEREAYLADAQGLGLKLLGPSVRFSDVDVTLEGKSLRLGLGTTRILSSHQAGQIVERRRRVRWSSFAQFRRDFNFDAQTLESLILAGALDDLGPRNSLLEQLDHEPQPALKLLQLEKELLGIYVSDHPCSPFLSLVDKLKGELDVWVGEILETRVDGNIRQGVLSTPNGQINFRFARSVATSIWAPGVRIALFGLRKDGHVDANWLLPLGPTLLITPEPEDLEDIHRILAGQQGRRPTILLLGDAYHVLPTEFWVADASKISARLTEAEIVYTWFDPWKENVSGKGFFDG